MNKQSASAKRTAPKLPTTQVVVSKVQSITAKKGGGQQAGWVGNLQRTVDKRSQTTPAAPGVQSAHVARKAALDPAKDNTANQRNPNHEQFYKSRGALGRPSDWEKSSKTPSQPGAK